MIRSFIAATMFVIFVASTPYVIACASSPFRSNHARTTSELVKIDIFDDLFIEQNLQSKDNPITAKRIHHADAFGWRKIATCSGGMLTCIIATAVLYPPAIPFISWSLKTKIITGTIAALASSVIIKQNVDQRLAALERHNNSSDRTYPIVRAPNYYYFCVKPLLKYIALPIRIGIGIGLLGIIYNRDAAAS